jgi:hypothetical protein
VVVGVHHRLAPRDETPRRHLTAGSRPDEDQEGEAAPHLGPVEPDATAAHATAPRPHRRDEPGQTTGSPHTIRPQKNRGRWAGFSTPAPRRGNEACAVRRRWPGSGPKAPAYW